MDIDTNSATSEQHHMDSSEKINDSTSKTDVKTSNENERHLMDLSVFELLKIVEKQMANDDEKAAVKNVFKQKYCGGYFHVNSKCLSQFSLDLKCLTHFGDKITKLNLQLQPVYIKVLLHATPNPMVNVNGLAFCEMTENSNVARQKTDQKAIRDFLNRLDTQFPQLHQLTLGYLFWCDDCPYFDSLVQPFASLTAITLCGHFSYSNFMNFINLNRQLEKVALVNKSPSMVNDEMCSWKLPGNFMQQLGSTLPNLKHLELFIPCKLEKLEKLEIDAKDHFKNLNTLKYGFHGFDTWTP